MSYRSCLGNNVKNVPLLKKKYFTFVFLLYGTPAPSAESQHPEAWPARHFRGVLDNKKLLSGTLPDNNLFLYIKLILEFLHNFAKMKETNILRTICLHFVSNWQRDVAFLLFLVLLFPFSKVFNSIRILYWVN